MAIKKTIEIGVNTGNSIKTLEELGGSFEDVYGELKPLSTVISELEDRLYQMAGAGEANTQEFKDLTQQVGEYKKVIIDTDRTVDGLSQSMGQSLGGALNGVASGFSVGVGALGAFGVESEKVEALLLKVQSAMAIQQGIQGIREAIPSYKALAVSIGQTAVGQKLLNVAQKAGAVAMRVLNVVMSANPVLLIVAGITALVGALAYFTSSTHKSAEAQEKLNKQMKEEHSLLDKTIKKVTEVNKHRLAVLQEQGASEEKLHEQRLKLLKAEELGRVASINQEKLDLVRLRDLKRLAIEEGEDDRVKEIVQELKDHKAKYNELKGQHKDYARAKELEDIKYQNHLDKIAEEEIEKDKARREKANANYKTHLENRLRAKREIEDRNLQLEKDGLEKSLEQDRLTRVRALEDLKADTSKNEQEKADLRDIILRESFEREKKIREEFEGVGSLSTVSQEALKLKREEELRIAQEQADAILQIQADAIARQRELEEQDRLATLSSYDKKLSIASDYANSVNNLSQLVFEISNAFGKQDEESKERRAKKQFQVQKALNLSLAIVDGFKAVTASLAQAPLAVGAVPNPAGIASLASAISMSLLNIGKIATAQYQSSGGGGGAGGVGGGGAPNIAGGGNNIANFNIVGNSGNNQLAQSLRDQPIKAYVVAGDVTTQQSLDRNKVNTASL